MKYCITCGKVVKQGHGHKSKQKYCNAECYQKRNIYGKEQEILDTLTKTDSVRITADLIGVDKNVLYNYIKANGIRRQVKWVGA